MPNERPEPYAHESPGRYRRLLSARVALRLPLNPTQFLGVDDKVNLGDQGPGDREPHHPHDAAIGFEHQAGRAVDSVNPRCRGVFRRDAKQQPCHVIRADDGAECHAWNQSAAVRTQDDVRIEDSYEFIHAAMRARRQERSDGFGVLGSVRGESRRVLTYVGARPGDKLAASGLAATKHLGQLAIRQAEDVVQDQCAAFCRAQGFQQRPAWRC